MAETAKRVVVAADDDRDILDLIAFHLRRSGYEVMTATDGDAAWALVEEHAPAVAILDVMMPGLNGYQITERIRTSEPMAELPVILVTARAGGADEQHGFKVGADRYIRKPFNPPDLVRLVDELLADG